MGDPVLHLIAGPNGAGKTTFHERIISPIPLEFVNADVMAAKRWPGNEAIHAYEASTLAAERRDELFAERSSFVTETVFSHPSKVELARKASSLGYLVFLYVILIPEELAIARVQNRVRNAGHYVPEEKIRTRYQRLWNYVVETAAFVNETLFYDNTRARNPFVLVARCRNGLFLGTPSWPAWTPSELQLLAGNLRVGRDGR